MERRHSEAGRVALKALNDFKTVLPPGNSKQTKKLTMDYSSENAAYFNTAIQGINNAANIASTNRMNKKTRQFNVEMYQRQRKDALDDWRMQNEYNHPSQQMARLREAGLNPNLVYGKGADNTAGETRSSSVQAWNPDVPQAHFVSPFNEFMNLELKQAQIDNLRTQNTVAAQEALLKAATTDSVLQNTEGSKFDLGQRKNLASYNLEAAAAGVRKLNADIDFTNAQNSRADQDLLLRTAQTASSIQEAISRMMSEQSKRETDKYQRSLLMGQMKSLEKDMQLKQLDIDLKRTGVQPHDKLWQRVLMAQWERIKNALPDSDKDGMRKKYLEKLDFKPYKF